MLNVLAGLVSTDIASFRRLSVNALLTIEVHNRDIITSMITNNITQPEDFEWKR
jgi:dynein heavy chain